MNFLPTSRFIALLVVLGVSCFQSCGPSGGDCESHSYRSCYNGDAYWYNDCGNREDLYDSCGSGEKCSDGRCVDECGSHAEKRCYSGDVYWYDSCGDREDLYDSCSGDEECSEGKCVSSGTCISNDHKGCYEGDVYWFDSCGEKEELFESCDTGESCQSGKCGGGTCDSHEYKGCYNGDAYWFDSCGEREEKFDDCSSTESCKEGECIHTGCQVTNDCKSKKCYNDDVWCYDNCGDKDHQYKGCSKGCWNGACLECDDGDYNCVGDNLNKCVDGFWDLLNCEDMVSDNGCPYGCSYSSNKGHDVCKYKTSKTVLCSADGNGTCVCQWTNKGYDWICTACFLTCGPTVNQTKCEDNKCMVKGSDGKWYLCQ